MPWACSRRSVTSATELPGAPSYTGVLFAGLDTRMTLADVEARLGEPDEYGHDRREITYHRPDVQIVFQFVPETRALYLITLLRPDWRSRG